MRTAADGDGRSTINPAIECGCRARFVGLKSRADLNGSACDVTVLENGRWVCRVDGDGDQETLVRAAPKNLEVTAAWPDVGITLPDALPRDDEGVHALEPAGEHVT